MVIRRVSSTKAYLHDAVFSLTGTAISNGNACSVSYSVGSGVVDGASSDVSDGSLDIFTIVS